MPKPDDFTAAEERKRAEIASAIQHSHSPVARSAWGIATERVRAMRRHGATRAIRQEMARNRARARARKRGGTQ